MSTPLETYTIYPLGDNAITIDFGNKIDNTISIYVLSIFERFRQLSFPFLKAIVPAYSSLSIFYDVRQVLNYTSGKETAFDAMKALLEHVITSVQVSLNKEPHYIKIPVCYSRTYAPDIDELARYKGLTIEEVVRIHTATIYRVYMIGFLPGFPYMGKVDDRIAISRKEEPRLKVEMGSVGIAGKQTGIYPQASPGGWQIIGRTPLVLFNPREDQPSLLKPGDSVQFYSITEDEFTSYKARTA